MVAVDGTNRWYFTIYGPNRADQTEPRYGLTDEMGKLSLTAVVNVYKNSDILLALPNMTDELVDCLMDYCDADANTSRNGAEQDYYDGLDVPYQIANSIPATLEELMLVKGFSGSIIFGEDYNLNGILDASENDGDRLFPPDNSDGVLDRGLRGVLTPMSIDMDRDSNGKRRININQTTKGLADAGLSAKTIEFIEIYRADGGTFSHPAELLNMKYKVQKDHGNAKAGDMIDSGVDERVLPIVCDRLTAVAGRVGLGRININTASAEVLAALPALDEAAARAIVSTRTGLPAETKATIAWLYTHGALDEDRFKAVAPMLVPRSELYSLQVIGFGVPCERFCVFEAVISLLGGYPRVVYLREITRLGLPIELDVESLEIKTE